MLNLKQKGKFKMSERLAKFIARSGVCSRRTAEELISQKRVSVNGEIIDTPAYNVEGSEKILVDGEKLPTKDITRLWLYHKPAGLVTSHKDEKDYQKGDIYTIKPHSVVVFANRRLKQKENQNKSFINKML